MMAGFNPMMAGPAAGDMGFMSYMYPGLPGIFPGMPGMPMMQPGMFPGKSARQKLQTCFFFYYFLCFILFLTWYILIKSYQLFILFNII